MEFYAIICNKYFVNAYLLLLLLLLEAIQLLEFVELLIK